MIPNDVFSGVKNNTVAGGCMSEKWREEEETQTFAVKLKVVIIIIITIIVTISTSIHGIMGRRFPDGGLLRHRK